MQKHAAEASRPQGGKSRSPSNGAQTPPPARGFPVAPVVALGVLGLAVGLFFLTRPVKLSPFEPEELATSAKTTRVFIQRYLDRARENPSDAKAHVDYALALYFNEMSRAAASNLENLEKLLKDDPHPKHYRAHCYRRFGDQETAARLYDEVVKAFPDFAPAYYERGRLAMERDDFAAAAKDFAKARDLSPRQFDPWLALGDLAVRSGEYAAAKDHLEKAAAIEPKDKVVQYQLGLALRGLGQSEAAERALAAGSGAIPKKMSDGWSNREAEFSKSVANLTTTAIHFVQTGRMRDGIAMMEQLRADNPDDVELLNNLACAYQDDRQSEKAVALLEKALKTAPNRDSTLVNFSSLYINLGDYPKAIEYAEKALKSNPTFGPAFFNKGNALVRQDKPAEALTAYREGVRFDPRNGKLHAAMATAYVKLNRHEDARREARRAVELDPDYLNGRLLLVEVCASMNDAAGAQAAYVAARAMAPNHPDVRRIGQKYFSR